jgi:LysM repeat protein
MDQISEQRKEPKVEVNHEPEEPITPRTAQLPGNSRVISKRWILIPILVFGIFGLAIGLWMIIKSGPIPGKRQAESVELSGLKTDLLKLKSEIDPLKKEILSLKEEQKSIEERAKVLHGQVSDLKEQIAGLAKRKDAQKDSLTGKKPAPKVTAYKIKKGDTLDSIAKKFRVAPEDLRRWNQLPAKGRLTPGKVITINSPTP